ncbi:arsenate reductase (glutaredoxin) [Ottowia caeni]|uniref:arsenate reductase (glutaredoxin) n=1 Tax=Ottowia caeni TaxID=2870339 RepID=UPI001E551C49|nr:arsenate reductase (glutaredoxin) [Ottowia caeni]
MSTVTIYHNPKCSTSRNALEMIRASGEEPRIVEYLKNPPSRDELKAIAKATGEPLRALVRTKQAEYLEQGLDNPALTDDQLIDAMLATPVLINRPIVVTALGARLGRPLEKVLEVLPSASRQVASGA